MCVQHAISIVCITLYYFDSVQWDLWWSIHLQGRKPGFDGQSSLVDYSPWGRKSWTQLSD